MSISAWSIIAWCQDGELSVASLPFVTSLRKNALMQLADDTIQRSHQRTLVLLRRIQQALVAKGGASGPNGVSLTSMETAVTVADLAVWFALFPLFHVTSPVATQLAAQFPVVGTWFAILADHKWIVKGLADVGLSDVSDAAVAFHVLVNVLRVLPRQ